MPWRLILDTLSLEPWRFTLEQSMKSSHWSPWDSTWSIRCSHWKEMWTHWLAEHPSGWRWTPPLRTLEAPVGALVHKTTYAPMIYVPVRNDFLYGYIHFLGKWEGVGPWKSWVFWAPNKDFIRLFHFHKYFHPLVQNRLLLAQCVTRYERKKHQTSVPPMALAYRLDAISQGPKYSISRAQPPPTCPSNGSTVFYTHQNHYARGRMNHRCMNS